MSSQRQLVTTRDLIEEAKKRIAILSICVFGLSYLMSLTSSSVWVNLPAAVFLIIGFRYFSMDLEMRKKVASYNGRANTGNNAIQEKRLEGPKVTVKKDLWRKKVNCSPVEDAIDHFTRHLVSEWVTDLWYSKLTPDREGPEELVQIMNGVLGEISHRMRDINLIDLLARDVIHLIRKHMELYRACQAKIEKKNLGSLSFDQRDMQLKITLAAENKLHPLMFSAESEHKVLQHIMDGLISLSFKPEDLQCSFFHYIVRELLACAVMRPVLNLANPRFINERIEQVVMSMRKRSKGTTTSNNNSLSKENGSSQVSSDDFSPFPDLSTGVELVDLKNTQSKNLMGKHEGKVNGEDAAKDPLLSVDAQSTCSWSLRPSKSAETGKNLIYQSTSGGQWGDVLGNFSLRKTQAVAPEHLENVWSKGRNYNSKDTSAGGRVHQSASLKRSDAVSSSNVSQKHKESAAKSISAEKCVIHSGCNARPQTETISIRSDRNTLAPPFLTSDNDEEDQTLVGFNETEPSSNSQNSSEDESRVTGLDSPTTKVWDGRSNRNTGVSYIRHPLESLDGKMTRRNNRAGYQGLQKQLSSRKRSRLDSQKAPVWLEVERTSAVSGDGESIHPLKQQVKDDDSSNDYDVEVVGRLQSGATASSSAAHSLLGSFDISVKSPQTAFLGDTFFKLRCEILGAHIVRSSSKTFAVYSISVIDAETNSWSIKRRYRHFEELHRRLKEYGQYKLQLPPKHFLSSGLDVPVIRERCKLLDEYLKKLMQIPSISASIDVWDFLNIDSQTHAFSSAFSIVETLPAHQAYNPHDNRANTSGSDRPVMHSLKPRRGYVESVVKDTASLMKHSTTNGLKSGTKSVEGLPGEKLVKDFGKKRKGLEGDLVEKPELFPGAASDPTFPAEWVPPNVSGPILDLVDVIFQLQEGAWIRRKAFWVAKQVLQLGMGDALDDWLVDKIQRLHRGSTVASGIKRVEQLLWPDGIFITKHPRRQRASDSARPSQSPPHSKIPDQISLPKEEDLRELIEQQEREVEQRAQFVYKIMIDNAPGAVISLLGCKKYEQCAKDLYFFLQSTVCLKQLALDLLELVLLCAYPELDHTFKQLHDEKHEFGEFKPT